AGGRPELRMPRWADASVRRGHVERPRVRRIQPDADRVAGAQRTVELRDRRLDGEFVLAGEFDAQADLVAEIDQLAHGGVEPVGALTLAGELYALRTHRDAGAAAGTDVAGARPQHRAAVEAHLALLARDRDHGAVER